MKYAAAAVKKYIQGTDLWLLLLTLLISLFGLALIYSATRTYGTNRYILIQGASIGLGVLCFLITSLIDFERLARYWPLILVLNVLLQLTLLKWGVGAEETGNNSWIRFDTISIGFQPGEIGKILFIFTFTRHLYVLGDRIGHPLGVLQLLLHAGLITGVGYYCSHDLGMAVTYILVFIIMLFASRMPLYWVGGICAVGAGAAPLLWKFVLSDFHKMRILVLFEPELSPSIAYHGQQSMIALGGGGLWGQGYMQGAQTQSSWLPAKHTDFIFSVCGEELGFIGCAALLLILTGLVLRVLMDSTKTDNAFGYLMCVGIGGMLMVQILINVGMCAGVMPVIGLTLPLVSYGGTSVVTTFAALGFIPGFVMRRKPSWLR